MPATAVSIQTIGDWQKQIKQGLDNVLAVSMDVMGRNGDEACKHAMILMAQSARHLTKTAPKNRKILQAAAAGGKSKGNNLRGAKYIETWKQGDVQPHRVYEYYFKYKGLKHSLSGTWETARHIANAGLAKRSWMWGLASIGGSQDSQPIAGTSRFYSILGNKVCGYIKENRLGYIFKTMPLPWEWMVKNAVENKIMKQAVIKLQNEWRSSVNRAGGWYGAPPTEKQLSSFFLRAG